jgi:predicted AlkP superfamily phosphohydrolase/phosphomutase
MTGRSPGNHGVFDFVQTHCPRRAVPLEVGPGFQTDPPTYTLVTSADVQCESIWSVATRHGCRSTALNFPCMFPAPEINGFVVPGYVPWSYLARAVRPRNLYSRLKEKQVFNARELATDWHLERKAIQGLAENELESWITFHTIREQRWFDIMRFLMREEPCELTAVLFDGVDRLQHLCYHLLHPSLAQQFPSASSQRLRSLCLEYFRQLDNFVAEIVTMAGSEARVFITSDHGFTLAGEQIFYANVWLQQHGYLKWSDGVPVDVESRLALEDNTESSALFDWSQTTAFALTSSSNGIFIRQAEAPGAPGVPAREYSEFRQQLITSLLAFTDPRTGQPVIERVLTRDQAFPGKHMDKAPDLTLILREPGFLSILRADAPLKQRRFPYGTHHPDGIFLCRGPGICAGSRIPPLSIVDIAPTLLYSLQLSVPSAMEGVIAASAFEPSFIATHPVRTSKIAPPQESSIGDKEATHLSGYEEACIMERLKALGYIE